MVKERTRLSQQRRQVGQIEPGRQGVQEAVQGLLVGRRGRAVEGTLAERTDSLEHQRVVGRVCVCNRGSPFASDDVLEKL